MNKQDVINYIMTTPENINPVILNQKIDKMIASILPPAQIWTFQMADGSFVTREVYIGDELE